MTEQQRQAAYSVYLNSKSDEVTVSEEGYRKIIELVKASTVCRWCKKSYTQQNPNVAGNLCLSCFSQEDRNGLTFQSELDPAIMPDRYISPYAPYPRPMYLFLDQAGHVHTTQAGPGATERAEENMRATARYWHFQVPEQAERNGETIRIKGFSFTIYGDVRTSSVVLFCYTEYRPDIEILFLARRDGPAVQINRRRGIHRQVFEEARAELEGTRTPDGKYLVKGTGPDDYRWKIWDSDVYTLVARRVEERLNGLISAKQAEPEEEPSE
jgi:hypothetical protein